MYKKYLLVVLLVLFLISCTANTELINNINDCDNDTCIINLINNELTADIDCNIFFEEYYQSACLAKKAKLTNNQNLCKEIKGVNNIYFRNFCNKQFKQDGLVIDKNILTCYQKFDTKELEDCFSNLVNDSGETYYCDYLFSDLSKNKCYWQSTGTTSCNGDKDCIIDLAIKTQDITVCQEISFDTFASVNINYYHECLVEVDKNKEDYIKCLDMTNQSHVTNCLIVFGYEFNLLEACELIEDNEERDSCIAQVAINTKNPTLCDGTSNKGVCYSIYGSQTHEIEYCALADDPFKIYACIVNSDNLPEKTYETCKMIKDNDYYNLCLTWFIHDVSICKNIKDNELIYSCEYKVNEYNRLVSEGLINP